MSNTFSKEHPPQELGWQLNQSFYSKLNVSYLNASLKKLNPENLELSFEETELIFVTFLFLEQRGWKARNEEKAGNSNSKFSKESTSFERIFKEEHLATFRRTVYFLYLCKMK